MEIRSPATSVGAAGLRPRVRRGAARFGLPLTLVMAVALSSAGCSSTAASSSTAPTRAADTSRTSAPSATTTAGSIADDEAGATPEPDAASAAQAATAAFCRPSLDVTRWLAALTPMLTSDAASAFASVLPSRVPCSRVTGPAAAGVGDEVTRLVEVPTDAGVVTVTVERPDPDSPWRVGRIAVPERR